MSHNDQPAGGYIPLVWPAVVGVAVYGALSVIFWTYLIKRGRRYMMTLCIGCTAMTVGFAVRIVFHSNAYQTGIYIITTLFILLSPCAFLATDYMLLARLTEKIGPELSLVTPRNLVKIFVGSDIVTFLGQSAGGGLSASKDASTSNAGSKIAMVALILQAVSFSLFTIVHLLWGHRLRKYHPAVWRNTRSDAGHDFRYLFWAMAFTTIGIITRSVFRVVEFAGGYFGYVAQHEIFFYLLDALPLALAMGVFVIFWPPSFIPSQPVPLVEDFSMSMAGVGQREKRNASRV